MNRIEWYPIPGFDNYEVSSIGEVLSFINGIRILKPGTHHQGYKYVYLKSNIRSKQRVHRLVALAFIDNPENKPHINHINGIKDDNRVCNLEWCTASENSKHAIALGLKNKPINNRKVIDIETSMIYPSIQSAANSIGISKGYLWNMINNYQPNKTNFKYYE